ncbi:hypothetical protein BC777_0186 [Yoonia maricola]|uniref:Uncharacterized protein n=1 Tax=Yoonia maricola TaxID=420999 RepID=A0A2M8WKA1_9RHOB|nr:hypothetical protein BC777_0186 [Yoonia maricola]
MFPIGNKLWFILSVMGQSQLSCAEICSALNNSAPHPRPSPTSYAMQKDGHR